MLPHTTDTYWNQFDKVSKYNVHLNYLERMWMAWYAYIGNDVLATGIMSFVMHELVYFGRSLPWIIIDRIPFFNKYKIQDVSGGRTTSRERELGADVPPPIAKDSHSTRAVGVREARPHLPLHRRTPSDLGLPPHGAILRPRDLRSLPSYLDNGLPNRHLLRP